MELDRPPLTTREIVLRTIGFIALASVAGYAILLVLGVI